VDYEMENGWIKLFRKLQDNEFWNAEKFTKGQAWVDLLLIANHKDSFFYLRGIKIDVKRGQIARAETALAKKWGWSREKVRLFLRTLKTRQQIDIDKSKLISIVTIINYDEYQADQTTNQTTNQTHTRMYKNEKNVNKTISPLCKSFDLFWAAYPKKKSKGQAEKVWNKIKPNEQLVATMIAKIKQAKTSEDWMKSNGQFIPYPATWLNAKGWEDELQTIIVHQPKTYTGDPYAD